MNELKFSANKLKQSGQTLLELVVGMSLITVVIGALAIITTYSLRNSQFSKNQALATKLAQENMEKIRTIKSSNFGVCLQGQTICSTWEDIWSTTFGEYVPASGCSTPCTFYIPTPPADPTCTTALPPIKPVCLKYAASDVSLDAGGVFRGQIIIEDESGTAATQKTVTSKVFWTDTTGEHASDLVTIFSKL